MDNSTELLSVLLALSATPAPFSYVFTYQPEGENAYGLSWVTFTVGADGKATSVLVEKLDIDKQGTFTRK